MKSKNLIGIIIVLVIAIGVVWLAKPNGENNTKNQIAAVSQALKNLDGDFDFGEISMAAGKVSRSVIIQNTGPEPVIISKIYTSCMCTTAKLIMDNDSYFGPYGMPGHGFTPAINKTIPSGAEATIEVVFDPAAHGPAGIGLIEREIYIENSVGLLTFGFKATVKP